MPTLKITNNSVQNPITVDLSGFMKLADDGGTDPYDPAFTQRVFSRSLLKEGATLALQQLVEKEQTWPLLLGPYANQPAMMAAIAQINQAINTPGAVLTWQDDGTSQPTYFDLVSGELQIEYSYRKGQHSYTTAKLLTFSQPLGRTASPRPYAAASGIGPLLMISPYASGGALAIGASTQAGAAGFGGQQQGASSGIFYQGAPSLAGDAQALLQVSYVGPLPNTASSVGVVPYAALSVLPDRYYRPLLVPHDLTNVYVFADPTGIDGTINSNQADGASQTGIHNLQFSPTINLPGRVAPVAWAGDHRLFAIARASAPPGASAALYTQSSPLFRTGQTIPIPTFGWGLYDLGTFSLRASQAPVELVQFWSMIYTGASAVLGAAIDVAGAVMLPDNATWYLNPTGIQASEYGYPFVITSIQQVPYTNTLLFDDVIGDQFIYAGQSQTFAPSPIGSVPSSARITAYSRGQVPRPDPKNGLPIIAILGVGQNSAPSVAYTIPGFPNPFILPGASWSPAQHLRTMAQVNVLERTRYVLP